MMDFELLGPETRNTVLVHVLTADGGYVACRAPTVEHLGQAHITTKTYNTALAPSSYAPRRAPPEGGAPA